MGRPGIARSVISPAPCSPSPSGYACRVRWLVDGNNLMGAHPDGWWRDRPAAQLRWARRVAAWCDTHDDPVVLLFDGAPDFDVLAQSLGNLRVEYAPRRGRDAADDRIVDLACDGTPDTVVVTADRGLLERLPPDIEREGPRTFASRLPER